MNRIASLFTPPVFEGDEERTHQARLLYVIAWTLIVSLTLMEISFIIAMPKNTMRWLLLASIADITNLALLALTQRGYIRSASAALIVELWALTTVYAWTAGGIHAPATMFYFVFVITVGLLLGSRAGAVGAVACSFTTLGMVYAEITGTLPPSQVQHTPLTLWIAIVFLITILISLQSLTTNTITKALQRAQQELKDRRQAEEALRASEARYRAVVENQTEFIVRWKPDSTRTFVNDAYCRYFSLTQEQAISTSFIPLIVEEDRQGMEERISRLLAGKVKTETYIHRVLKPEGAIGWQEWIDQVIYDVSGKVIEFQSVGRDITERKQAEERLKQFREVMDKSNDAIFFIDPATSRYIDFNQTALNYLQYSREELPQLSVIQIAQHVHNLEGWNERVAMVEKEGGLIFEAEYQRKDKTIFPVEVSARMLEYGDKTIMVAVLRDITERKLAEEALRRREELYRGAIEAAGAVPYYQDYQTEQYTFIGERIQEMTGYSTTEMTPALWHAIGQETYMRGEGANLSVEEAIQKARAGQLKVWQSEVKLLKRDGQMRWITDSSVEIVNEQGQIIGSIGILQDITERKRAEEEIQQLNTELETRVKERTAQLNEANQNLHQEKVRLEQYSRQRELMGTMTDLLQASLTTDEASGIVSRYMQLLFPNRDGALYLLNASGTLEPIAVWGEQKSLDTMFGMNDCWALRRGKPYRFGSGSPNPPCAHVGKEITQSALCIPLTAQGESIGSLHILTESIGEGGVMDDEEQRFIETIADSVALALANVRLRERLRIQSIRDGLTGLFNRRYLDETLPREIHRAERGQRPISVLMFDIDSFKKFNDTYGHDAGDVVLKRIAELILSKIRPSDIACRYGGEEFTIILPDTSLEIAHARAESLREAASQMGVQHNGKDLGTITISMGVAAYPQHGISRDALIKSADEASYQAKERGKNRVVLAVNK